MDEIELKPCPFCGGTDLSIETFELDNTIQYVLCGDCQCEGPAGNGNQEAAELWNWRY